MRKIRKKHQEQRQPRQLKPRLSRELRALGITSKVIGSSNESEGKADTSS
jgi:hypothetical protein